MNDRKEIGAILKEIRINQGQNINKFAASCGLVRHIIYEIEKGSKNYSIDSLLKYCSQISLPIDELIKHYQW